MRNCARRPNRLASLTFRHFQDFQYFATIRRPQRDTASVVGPNARKVPGSTGLERLAQFPMNNPGQAALLRELPSIQ